MANLSRLGSLLGNLGGGALSEGLQGYQESQMLRQQQEALAQQEADKEKKRAQFAALLSGKPLGQTGPMPDMQGMPQDMMQQEAHQQQEEMSLNDLLAAGTQAGLSPQELSLIQRSFTEQERSKRKDEDVAIKRDRLKQREEAPERKEINKEIRDYRNRALASDQQIADYKALKKLADKGDIKSGPFQNLLDKAGIGAFFRNPTTDMAEKLIGDINTQSLLSLSGIGTITDQKMAAIAKTNPSLLMRPESIKGLTDVKILSAKVPSVINAEINKIKKQSKDKGQRTPLDIVDRAIENAKPKIEKLHEKMNGIVDKITSQAEDPKKQDKVFSSLPDASTLRGRRVRDTETGKILVSNGSEWVPA